MLKMIHYFVQSPNKMYKFNKNIQTRIFTLLSKQ